MKRLIIIAVVSFLINSCSDDNPLFDPTYFGDGFKGITFTLENSSTPIKPDPTDWYYSISYSQPKGQNTSGIEIEVKSIRGLMFAPAYPNPSHIDRGFSISFAIPQDMNVKIYIINKNYEIVSVLINDELSAGRHLLYVNNNIIAVPGVYRIIMESEGFYSKGDVWIKGSNR